MTPRVLILSSLYDFSTDLVALRLESAGVPYLRLNREEFRDHRLTLDPLRCELKVLGPVGLHRVDSSLASVLFRQPVFLRNTPPLPLTAEEQLERSQWMGFLRGLCVFADAAWMNPPAATYLAESKPYQLAVASQCGFNVPETVASNDAARIRELFPDQLVVKSLDTVLLRDGTDCLFTYTTLNPDAELTDATVQAVPLLAQRALEFKADLRVTVVGTDVFAVRILSQGRGIRGDWRIVPKQDLEFQPFELSPDLSRCCLMLARLLGLSFAAIDLVETPEGTFFIEVNPTGEWGWLSNQEQPIDFVIAAWLAQPCSASP